MFNALETFVHVLGIAFNVPINTIDIVIFVQTCIQKVCRSKFKLMANKNFNYTIGFLIIGEFIEV